MDVVKDEESGRIVIRSGCDGGYLARVVHRLQYLSEHGGCSLCELCEYRNAEGVYVY